MSLTSQVALSRLMKPRSVALVGASPSRWMARNVAEPMLASDTRIEFVNPRYDEVFGRPCYPALADIPGPVDAVAAMVRADLTPAVVEQAAHIGAGGVVVFSAGFRESGPQGEEVQSRLVKAAEAGGLAVCGPNCTGLVTVRSDANLYTGPRPQLAAGGVGVISHSGAMLSSCMNAGCERGLGFSSLISSGNEAVTTTVDYLHFFIADDDTQVICVVMERVDNADALFSAARRAAAAGKRIIVLKLGRTSKAVAIARSHTGSLLGEAWAFDVAAREAGIILADDVDDLFDLAAVLEQAPAQRRPRGRKVGVAVLSTSGGMAALSSDLAERADVHLPPLDDLTPWLDDVIPGTTSPNPLDLTGFLQDNIDTYVKVVRRYLEHPSVDAALIVTPVDQDSEAWSEPMVAPLQDLAETTDKLVILASVEEARVGSWVKRVAPHVTVGRGLKGTLRGIAALDFCQRPIRSRPAPAAAVARPDADLVNSEAGALVTYEVASKILAAHGVPMVPSVRFAETDRADPTRIPVDFGDLLVVKLSDVPHRTELAAVRLGVRRSEAAAIIESLRREAGERGLPQTVLVQPQLEARGELFVGAHIDRDTGPIVLFGIGGVHVELLRDVAAAPAPIATDRVEAMIDDLRLGPMLRGVRGSDPWDLPMIAELIVNVSRVAAGARDWLESLDLNPVIRTSTGLLAVDAVLIAKAQVLPEHESVNKEPLLLAESHPRMGGDNE